MSTPVNPSSQQPGPLPEDPNSPPPPEGGKFHEYLGMEFSPEEWKQFMKNIEQSVSRQIKHEEQTWKEEMQRERRELGGG